MNPQRIRFIDIMRGVATIVMVMGHSIDAVLSPDARTTALYGMYDYARGFTAPIFLFVSGLAFAVATEKRWEAYLQLSVPLARRMGKILLLLAAGYALHLPFFSLEKLVTGTTLEEYRQFFIVDILHLIGVSLLLLHILMLLSRTPGRFAYATLLFAVLIVVSSPLVSTIDVSSLLSPVIAPYVNTLQPSLFPLFPYGGFLFLGVVVGHYYIEARDRAGDTPFMIRMFVLGALAMLTGIVADLVPLSIYPPHIYWNASPNFFLVRIGVVLSLATGFFLLRKFPDWLEWQLGVIGRFSFFIYVAHLVVVFGSAANRGLRQIVGLTFTFLESFLTGLAVLGTMLVMVHLWRILRTRHTFPARLAQAIATGCLVALFLSRPY